MGRDGRTIPALTLPCREKGKILSRSVNTFSWKSLNILFQETKNKYFDISFWNSVFPFERNIYLTEKKSKQSTSVGNPSSIIKCFTLGLGKKKITTHLFIDMPEVILAINLAWEDKKKSRMFYKLSWIGKILSTISFQFRYKSIVCLALMESWNTEWVRCAHSEKKCWVPPPTTTFFFFVPDLCPAHKKTPADLTDCAVQCNSMLAPWPSPATQPSLGN